ncbi:hypothetical protein DFS33DRAFT_1385339 [Desarmillaria ectypa]|nr:hypothetical protein DFS33DRAFT_1385339 [Desarmillaria ectypa]
MKHPRYFPHIKSYTSNSLTISFRYLRPIDLEDARCATFLAETIGPCPTRIIVKSVEQYGYQAQRFPADANSALYHGVIDSSVDAPSNGSLLMVIMEDVVRMGAFFLFKDRPIPEWFIAEVYEDMRILHGCGFVLGNLRHQNIVVTPDEGVKLIGRVSDAVFPKDAMGTGGRGDGDDV